MYICIYFTSLRLEIIVILIFNVLYFILVVFIGMLYVILMRWFVINISTSFYVDIFNVYI